MTWRRESALKASDKCYPQTSAVWANSHASCTLLLSSLPPLSPYPNHQSHSRCCCCCAHRTSKERSNTQGLRHGGQWCGQRGESRPVSWHQAGVGGSRSPGELEEGD